MLTRRSLVCSLSEKEAVPAAAGFKARRSCCGLGQPDGKKAVSLYFCRGAWGFLCLLRAQTWRTDSLVLAAALPPPRQPFSPWGGGSWGPCQLPGLSMSMPLPAQPRTRACTHSQRVLQLLQYHSVSGEEQISKYPASLVTFSHPIL